MALNNGTAKLKLFPLYPIVQMSQSTIRCHAMACTGQMFLRHEQDESFPFSTISLFLMSRKRLRLLFDFAWVPVVLIYLGFNVRYV
jgi:hypothetical protein